MDRRAFLKVAAALPAVVAVPALAAAPVDPKDAMLRAGQVGSIERFRVIESPQGEDWLRRAAKSRQLGYAHGFDVAPSRAERRRLLAKFRADAAKAAKKWGMVITERDEHYIAPLPDNRDPYGSRGFLAAKYTLGYVE